MRRQDRSLNKHTLRQFDLSYQRRRGVKRRIKKLHFSYRRCEFSTEFRQTTAYKEDSQLLNTHSFNFATEFFQK